jgi:hypothetical protein
MQALEKAVGQREYRVLMYLFYYLVYFKIDAGTGKSSRTERI